MKSAGDRHADLESPSNQSKITKVKKTLSWQTAAPPHQYFAMQVCSFSACLNTPVNETCLGWRLMPHGREGGELFVFWGRLAGRRNWPTASRRRLSRIMIDWNYTFFQAKTTIFLHLRCTYAIRLLATCHAWDKSTRHFLRMGKIHSPPSTVCEKLPRHIAPKKIKNNFWAFRPIFDPTCVKMYRKSILLRDKIFVQRHSQEANSTTIGRPK